MTATVDAMELARAERAELAAFLDTLTPAQWEAPSLCAGWRVRDVVAHMFSYEDLGPIGLVGRFLRGGVLPDRVNAYGVAAHTRDSTEQLLDRVRARLTPTGLTAGLGGRIALTDGTIHHQDIRRPLGAPREIPADRLTAALDTARRAPTIGAGRRIRGLRLTATDLDWSAGHGPHVEGPGEALLMVIAGRRGIVPELSGPGVPALSERIGG